MPIDGLLTNAVFFEDTMYVVQAGFRVSLDDVYGNLSIITHTTPYEMPFLYGMEVL
jgi:hypothetical protein